jgi:hypothetical protein
MMMFSILFCHPYARTATPQTLPVLYLVKRRSFLHHLSYMVPKRVHEVV